MAVSLDRVTGLDAEAVAAPVRLDSGPVPPEAPLAMPVQDLRRAPMHALPRATAGSARAARWFVFGGALAVTGIATWQMLVAVGFGTATLPQYLLVGLFTVTFGWIALSAMAGIAGFARLLRRRPDAARHADLADARIALIMPVHNEDPGRSMGGLLAMAEGLVERAAGGAFDIFILSDSTDPDAWIAEAQTFHALRDALAGRMAAFYRRRHRNTGKKAGNVADFVRRWGGRYRYMVVLDADSLMAPDTILSLAAAMQAEPDLGLLQTVPRLAGRRSLFARLQQFAGAAYGPLVAEGVAAWQGDDGNFWGHNAIIRTEAFAAACGLPDLRGVKPFGGPIMSHDFVEAALLRRAGWKVRMDARLGGSWEEAPPGLVEFAQRDRRWAQGNLQHLGIIGAAGLAWPNRAHFAIGIMSYLASPLWLMLILVGLAIALQAHFIRPEYFTQEFQLFPTWPSFESERMIALFAATMAVLFLPKLLAIVAVLGNAAERRRFGGAAAVIGSAVLETLLSALVAPVTMLTQTRHVAEILTRRDSGWAVQRRDDGGLSLVAALRFHRDHLLAGIGLLAAAWLVSPAILAWLSPMVLGLALAPVTTWITSSPEVGDGLRRIGLLRIPEEVARPSLFDERDRAAGRLEVHVSSLISLIGDPAAVTRHRALLLPTPAEPRGTPDMHPLLARAKIGEARSVAEALAWLNRPEKLAVLAHPDLLDRLAALATGEPPAPGVLGAAE